MYKSRRETEGRKEAQEGENGNKRNRRGYRVSTVRAHEVCVVATQQSKNTATRIIKMPRVVQLLTAKPDGLSLIPRTQKVEGENVFLKAVL